MLAINNEATVKVDEAEKCIWFKVIFDINISM